MSSWLITGGSSGVGLALSRAVLNKGCTAVLTSRNVAKAKESAADIEKSGGHWLQLDYSDSDLEQKVKDTVSRYKIDTLVNNAGYAAVGAVEDYSHKGILAQYESNVFGPIRAVQAVIPSFRERQTGVIANIGSAVSFNGMPGNTMYGSTKSALRTITEGLALELADFGIRVHLFELGRFETNFGNAISLPVESGFSAPYRGTAVDKTLTYLRNMGPANGDPQKAAERIYEVVTQTGMATDEKVKGKTRVVLGPEAQARMVNTGKSWQELGESMADFAASTSFK
ncbi:MAG: hypothetical protein Q9159_001102 [Coniocarpon cinnabarinum]